MRILETKPRIGMSEPEETESSEVSEEAAEEE